MVSAPSHLCSWGCLSTKPHLPHGASAVVAGFSSEMGSSQQKTFWFDFGGNIWTLLCLPFPLCSGWFNIATQKEGEMGKRNYFVINFLIAEHPDVAKALCSKMDLSALLLMLCFHTMLGFSSFLNSLSIYPWESRCLGYIFMILWLLTWRVEPRIYPFLAIFVFLSALECSSRD